MSFFLDALGIRKHHKGTVTTPKKRLNQAETKASSQTAKVTPQTPSNAPLSTRRTTVVTKGVMVQATPEDEKKLQEAIEQYKKVRHAAEEQLQSKNDQKDLCHLTAETLSKKQKQLTPTFVKHQYLFSEANKTCVQLQEHENNASLFLNKYNKKLTPEDYRDIARLDTTEEIAEINEMFNTATQIVNAIDFETKTRNLLYDTQREINKINDESVKDFTREEKDGCKEIIYKTEELAKIRNEVLKDLNNQDEKIASGEKVYTWIKQQNFSEFMRSKNL